MLLERTRLFLFVVLVVAFAGLSLPAQQAARMNPNLFADMKWRNIGPFRAGRTKAAAGHPSQPYTFYIGMCNGGVWKTTDAGRTWKPIFDDQDTGSIGWVSVAPSDPNILYVGERRRVAAAGFVDWRWHVQVDRRGQDVDASRPA